MDDVQKMIEMNKNATLSELREAVAFVTEIQEGVQQMHF
jgi:hypothetical protein